MVLYIISQKRKQGKLFEDYLPFSLYNFFKQVVYYQLLRSHLPSQCNANYWPRPQYSGGALPQWRWPYWKPGYSAFAQEDTEKNCVSRWRSDHPRRGLGKITFEGFGFGSREVALFVFRNKWRRCCWRHSREVCGEKSWITAIQLQVCD